MSDTGIVLFVFHRPGHTRKVLQGLKKNKIDKLYIFADGIPDDASDEQIGRIKQVRNIVNSIDWCKTEVVIQDKNLGLKRNWIYGFNYTLEKHPRIMVLEDDCIPSKDFVNFMEACLDKYADNERVMNVHGYAYPIRIPKSYKYDIYFSRRTGSWGQGTWRRAWKLYDENYDDFERIKKSSDLRAKLDTGEKDLFEMMRRDVEGISESVGVWWAWSVIKNNGLSVQPVRTMVRNIGVDGTGVHSIISNKNRVFFRKTESRQLRFPPEVAVNFDFESKFKEFASRPAHNLLSRIRNKARAVIGRG